MKLWRHVVTLTVVGVVSVSDLLTKRWAEENLATQDHLLPVRAEGAHTVGDAIRQRFPELTDADLSQAVYRVNEAVKFSGEERLIEVASQWSPLYGFLAFPSGRLDKFATRIALPNRDEAETVTLVSLLKMRLPHLDDKERKATLEKGLFPFRGPVDLVDPSSPATEGALYALAKREIILIPNHLDFSYAENPAGAWGLLSGVDDDLRRNIFFVLSIVAIGVVLYLLIRPPSQSLLSLIALSAILGGAIGNVVDRLTLHYVVDFIHMYWGDYHWPRYNIADIGITLGVVALLLSSWARGRKQKDP